MEMIGLIAAMPQESGALLKHIKEWRRTKLGGFRGARFRLMNRNCVLVTSGMGVKHAREATHTLLAATRPHLLISFGIAGAANDDLQIGDVVVARNTCLLENVLPGQFLSLASLSETAQHAASQALQPSGARLFSGTVITTRGAQGVLQGKEEITNPVLEMETAGIAQVAAENGIPLISIRSISDGPQSPIPFNLEAILDDKYDLHFGKLLMMVLCHPQIILQSRHMMQNSRKAAYHAARALIAVLSQPSSITSESSKQINSIPEKVPFR
jgi:adenosylhomocysteine nucleosidase